MIAGIFDNGAMPVLERMLQFTEQRQAVLANNVANLSTPFFKPGDLDVGGFQKALSAAVDRRRRQPNPVGGPLSIRDTRQLRFSPDGLQAIASPSHENIMFHDQNNRDLERIMQDVAENTMAHNAAVELMRNQFDMIKTAIRERI